MDILTRLAADHLRFQRQLASMGENLFCGGGSAAPGLPERVRQRLSEFIASVEEHEELERRVLCPRLVEGECGRAVVRIEREHARLDEALRSLSESLPLEAEAVQEWSLSRLAPIQGLLIEHMINEEETLFSCARRCLPREELEELGRSAGSGHGPR